MLQSTRRFCASKKNLGITQAFRADSIPEGWMPGLLETKVYHLGRALYERIEKVIFEKFVASLLQLN